MKIKEISKESKDYFQRFYKGHTVIGLMEEEGIGDRVIVRSKPGYNGWTPYGTARDCGDHYIVANYSRYDRVEKKTLKVTEDVEDR